MTVVKRRRRSRKKSGKIWQAVPYSYLGLSYIDCSDKDCFSYSHLLAEPRLDVVIDVSEKDENRLSMTPDRICEMMISLGNRALDLSKEGLLHEVEEQCLDQALQLYQKSDEHLPNAALTEIFLKSLSMICTAILSSREADTFHFSKKSQIISLIKEMLKAENLQTSVRNAAIIAVKDLSNVKPSLSPAERQEIISISVKSIFSLLQEEKMSIGSSSPKDPDSTEVPKSSFLSETRRSSLKIKKTRIRFNTRNFVRVIEETLFPTCMASLETMLINFLKESLTAEVLRDMFEVLEPWISSKDKLERENAMRICYVLLRNYSQAIARVRNYSQTIARVPSDVQSMRYFIGVLAPYTKDSSIPVRDNCLQSFSCLACIQHQLQGKCGGYPANIVAMEPADITHFIWKYLDVTDVPEFFRMVIKTFICEDLEASSTSAVWVGMVFNQLGPRLQGQVQEIITIVQNILPQVQSEESRKSFLQALQPLATHQPDAVVQSLLKKPFHSEKDAVDVWMSLGRIDDFTMASKILNASIDMMNQDNHTLAIEASFGFNNVIKTFADSYLIISVRFAELFCTTLRNVSLLSPVQTENASRSCRISVDTLKNIMVLRNIGNVVTTKGIVESECWSLISDINNHKDGVILLTRILIGLNRSEAQDIIQRLLSSLNSPSMAWRLTGIAFFSEVMGHGILKGMKLTKKLINVMKEQSGDTSGAMRAMAMRALGRVATFSPKKAKKYKGDIIRTIIKAIYDEDNSSVVEEIFVGLDNTLKILNKKDIGKDFNIVAVQSRFYMDAKDANVRASAIRLFGRLGSITKVKINGFFALQVQCCLGKIINQLQDPDINIFTASVNTLQCCLPFLGSTALLQEFVREPIAVGYNHQRFLERFFVPLYQDIPELLPVLVKQCCPYFCSTEEDNKLRAAAQEMIAAIKGVIKHDDVNSEKVMQLIASCSSALEMDGDSTGETNRQETPMVEEELQIEALSKNQD